MGIIFAKVLQKLSPSQKTTCQITEIQFVFNHVDPSILHNYGYLRYSNRHFCVWLTHFHDLLSTFAPPRSYRKEFGAVAVFAMWRFCQSKIYGITLDHIWWVGNWVVNGNTSTYIVLTLKQHKRLQKYHHNCSDCV